MKKLQITLLVLLTIHAVRAQDYRRELAALNNYLRTFENGFFGFLEVKDGFVYTRFKTGGFNKFKMEDMQDAVVEDNKVIFRCKNDAYCQTTDWKVNSNKYSHFYGDNTSTSQLYELKNLLNNFKKAYLNEGKTIENDDDWQDEDFDELAKIMSSSDNNKSNTSSSNTSSNNASYLVELKKLNDFLKTFDDGYYGYLEIKDGILYDRFKSGKYTKTAMNQLATAKVETEKRKIIIPCKNGESCVFSTYTDSYHSQLSFSQSTDFNTTQLVTLFNNLINAYNGGSTTPTSEIKYTESSEFLDGTKNNEDANTVATQTESINYTAALAALNAYLTQFDGTRYKGIEIKNGMIYSNYANGNYSKAYMSDIDKAYLNSEYKYVKLACKNGKECVYSSITGSYHEYFNFQTSTGKDLNKMLTLLNNFVDAYNTKNSSNSTSTSPSSRTDRITEAKQRQESHSKEKESDDEFWEDFALFLDEEDSPQESSKTSDTSSTQKYRQALNKLNDYLPTFNKETYRTIEVKNGYVYFAFNLYNTIYTSKISISSLKQNTVLVDASTNTVKIQCKGESDCFYSTYSNGYVDHFQFYTYSVKEISTIRKLLYDFIQAL